jgi:hypothetical protein
VKRLVILALLLASCDKKVAPPATIASASASAPAASSVAPAASIMKTDALPNQTHAAKAARATITKANYKSELDKLDQAVAK